MTSKTTTVLLETDEAARFPVFPSRDDMQNWLYIYAPIVLTTAVCVLLGVVGHRRGQRGACWSRYLRPL